MKKFKEFLLENERTGGKALSEYPRYQYSSRIIIYRARNKDGDEFHKDDYITLSPKFAIEHAESTEVYQEEQQIVIRATAHPKDVVDASNPGEYFYKGNTIHGDVVYKTLGYDYDSENVPDISKITPLKLTESASNLKEIPINIWDDYLDYEEGFPRTKKKAMKIPEDEYGVPLTYAYVEAEEITPVIQKQALTILRDFIVKQGISCQLEKVEKKFIDINNIRKDKDTHINFRFELKIIITYKELDKLMTLIRKEKLYLEDMGHKIPLNIYSES